MDNDSVVAIEKTIFGAAYGLLSSKKWQVTIGGILTTFFTWIMTFIFAHLQGQLGLKPEVASLIPMAALVCSGAVIAGMLVLVHGLAMQDHGKEAAALNLASVKVAAAAGLDAATDQLKAAAPDIAVKLLTAQAGLSIPNIKLEPGASPPQA